MSSQGLPSSSTHEEGRKFTCFLRLPVELQLLVWEHAFQSNRKPRIALLRVHSAPNTRLSHSVLNLNNVDASLGWPVSNRLCLAETDPVSSLLTTCHRSRVVTLKMMGTTFDTPWLRRLGLTGPHIDPGADIVFFGGDGNVILATPSMMAMSLVLGNELPNIMVPALAFVSHVIGDLSLGTVEPVSAALARLRAVDPVWNEIFRPGANTLPRPGLPRNIYFLLGPVPSTRLADRRPRLDCLHFEHLSFFPPSATAAAPMTRPFDIQGGFQGLENYVSMRRIQDFWDNVQNAPGFPGTIPNFSFVQIRT